MSDHANPDEQDSPDAELPETVDSPSENTVEAYETEDGVVFYDAQNPLAWLKATTTLTLTEQT